jgi:hypothetical protein
MKEQGFFEEVEYDIINGAFKSSTQAGANKKLFNVFHKRENDIIEDIQKEFLKQNPKLTIFDFDEENSKYGRQIEHPSKRAKETFAEAFASLTCGKPNKIALALKEVLKQYF